ncbi:poly-gamma-glutamate biosynthesis protein PgsC [Rhodopirellula europaea]|uniref:Capsule biosynthesis protein CapC n=1 Tax=Rhodopirellula europaea 6C TaxID=1263867 RepID=M2AEZ8_9BACT|nr:poly-gamma-glutamate biosynthesis protein PgsC [Rhodopirellula europaea]EMB15695.1 capsule biosynthesis protein CapC [Rhodopirellula europaea 6C]
MEWLALSIGIGLVVSLIFTEAFGLSVGGMIVPGYLALAFDQPATIIATIVAALVTAWVVYQIDRWAILFGRRRVVLTMVVGFAIAAVLRSMVELTFPSMPVGVAVEGSTSAASMMMAGTTVIGFVIPGLVALWIARSGVVQTLSPLVIATSLVYLVLVTAGVETLV